jgi:outer membrane protein, multidrug efflux system
MPPLLPLRIPGGLALLFLFSACAPVGPDHAPPAMDLPASFSHAGITWQRQNQTAHRSPENWWQIFRDPTLDSLILRSLQHNQELAAAAARVREAREISNMARSRYFPAVDMGLGAERTRFRFRGPGGGDNLASNFTLPIDLRYEIDTWGKVRRQVEAATAREQASAHLLTALHLTISAEIAQTYWALRAVDADRAVLNRTLEIRSKAFDLLASRRNAGAISGLDLARAETELAAANADRIQLDQTRAELLSALAVLTGRAATGASLPENSSLPTPPQPPRVLPASLLRQRPDIRAAEQNVAAANAEIGVATAAYFPSVSLQASSGLDSATLENLFDASSLVWSLGANALTPLTNLRYLQAQRRATVAAHEAASAEYRQAVLEALREVETALQTSSILLQRQKAQDQALAAARKAFELAVKRFEQGLVSFLDVVEAERTRLDAERASNAIRAERLAVSVSLAKALGGTW